MILRSFLFVPADSERKLEKAKSSSADALILDLEDAVAADGATSPAGWRANTSNRRPRGRRRFGCASTRWAASTTKKTSTPSWRGVRRGSWCRSRIRRTSCVRSITISAALEDKHGLPARSILLMPVASETPMAVATLMDYRNPPPRLAALTWGAEDLSAALGAATNRDETGGFAFTYRVVRSLALIAAKAAGVEAIDTLHADFRDMTGLTRAAQSAQREGFTGMLAIHPDQVPVINEAFTPSAADIDHAYRVVAAFSNGEGVASLDGKMLDQPHLKQAKHILELDQKIRMRR